MIALSFITLTFENDKAYTAPKQKVGLLTGTAGERTAEKLITLAKRFVGGIVRCAWGGRCSTSENQINR